MLWFAILIVAFTVCLFTKILFPTKVLSNFDISSTPFKELSVSKQDHQMLISIMRRINSLNIPYFLIAGSLMGALRYENRMPWDDDIDIGILAEEKEAFEQIDFKKYGLGIRKVSFGYKIYDLSNNRQANLESTFPFVDVFTFVKEDGKYVYEGTYARNKWVNEYFTEEQLYPLSTCLYSGMMLPCPNKSKEFLTQAFPKWDSLAYISGSHTGSLLFREYTMPINEKTTNEILLFLKEFSS